MGTLMTRYSVMKPVNIDRPMCAWEERDDGQQSLSPTTEKVQQLTSPARPFSESY